MLRLTKHNIPCPANRTRVKDYLRSNLYKKGQVKVVKIIRTTIDRSQSGDHFYSNRRLSCLERETKKIRIELISVYHRST